MFFYLWSGQAKWTYIFENSKDGLTCSNTFEWCNQGIQPEIDHLQNIRYLEDLGGEYEDNLQEDELTVVYAVHTRLSDDSILSGKHILVCEDHPLKREIAIRLLNNKGMMVECAENGQLGVDAFEKSELYHFDLILMDAGMNAHLSKPIDSVKLFDTLRDQLSNPHLYHRGKVLVADDVEVNRAVIRASLESMMPNMDGFELIKNIRANHAFDTIVVIANTQYDEMTQEENLRRMGVNGFIYKPNSPARTAPKSRCWRMSQQTITRFLQRMAGIIFLEDIS